jgi:hypothetical protein
MASLADQVPYPTYTTNEMQDNLVEDMMRKLYKSGSPEIRQKIEKAYQEYFGVDMLTSRIERERFQSYCLNGVAGNGKTSSVEGAARVFARLTKMELLTTRDVVRKLSIDPAWVPNSEQIIIHTKSMGGMMSAQDLYGTPCFHDVHLPDGSRQTRVRNIPEEVVSVMRFAGASVLLLDDFWNCSEMVQNAALQVVDRAQLDTTDLGNCYVTVTGNLGAIDGAYVNPPSTPMATRMKMVHVIDTPQDWVNRINEEFNDAMGDAYVGSYIHAMSEAQDTFNIHAGDPRLAEFIMKPTTSNSRTWSALVSEMRHYLNDLGENGKINLGDIERIAKTCVGPIAGISFASYAHTVLSGVDLVARDLINTGKLDTKKFSALVGDGISFQERDKSHQFASSFANHAARLIISNPDKFDTAIKHYSRGLFLLDPATLQLSLNYLADRLSNVESLSEDGPSKFAGTRRSIKQPVLERMVSLMSAEALSMKKWDESMRSNVISNLSGTSRWKSRPEPAVNMKIG